MSITSENFTVDNLETSLQFVFRHKYADYSPVMLVIQFVFLVLLVAVWLFFLIAFLAKILSPILLVEKNSSYSLGFALFLLFLLLTIVSSFRDMFWGLNGKEIVEISSDGIIIRHQTLIFKTSKKFSEEKIPCIFVSRKDPAEFSFSPREVRFFNFHRGRIAFNSGKTLFGGLITFRFGSILEPDEARQVVAIIHKRFPQYKCPAKHAS